MKLPASLYNQANQRSYSKQNSMLAGDLSTKNAIGALPTADSIAGWIEAAVIET